MPRPNGAISGQAVRSLRGINGARNRKRTQVKIIVGIAFVIHDWSDYVRAIKGVAAPAVVVPEIIVQVERLSALQRKNAVQAPAILQLLHAAATIGELVGKVPREAVRDVEIRWTILKPRLSAVIGLGSVRLEIFAVAGVVE